MKQVDSHFITIGIASYLGFHTLARTVRSIETSLPGINCKGKEIIICINGRDEKTLQVAEELEMLMPALIKICTLERASKSGAINEIARLSKGDVLLFVDDDILLDKNCLSSLYQALIQSEKLDFVWADLQVLEISGMSHFDNLAYKILNLRYRKDLFKNKGNYARGCCMGMRRANFPTLPENLINEDEYLQIYFWGTSRLINEAKYGIFGVSSIRQYFARQFRLKAGHVQMQRYFSLDRRKPYEELLARRPDWNKLLKMPISNLILVILNEIICKVADIIFKAWGHNHWIWSRNTHDHHKPTQSLYFN